MKALYSQIAYIIEIFNIILLSNLDCDKIDFDI